MSYLQVKSIVLISRKPPNQFQLTYKQLLVEKTDVLVKILCFSVDPVMKFWASGTTTYFSKVNEGDIFNCFGLGIVVQGSQSYPKDCYVFGNLGTSTYSIISEEKERQVFIVPSQLVKEYGSQRFVYLINNGLAAYAGVKVLKVEKGKTGVVSTASGATGRLVCHLLRKKGCKIIGLTSQKKMKEINKICDIVIDYKDADKMSKILSQNPFNYYFDNVGDQMLDLILKTIQPYGRIACCGAISNYQNYSERGIHNILSIISKRLLLEGIAFLAEIGNIHEVFQLFKDAELHIDVIESKDFQFYYHQVLKPGNRIRGKIIVKFQQNNLPKI